jgi:hypothetical protein
MKREKTARGADLEHACPGELDVPEVLVLASAQVELTA